MQFADGTQHDSLQSQCQLEEAAREDGEECRLFIANLPVFRNLFHEIQVPPFACRRIWTASALGGAIAIVCTPAKTIGRQIWPDKRGLSAELN